MGRAGVLIGRGCRLWGAKRGCREVPPFCGLRWQKPDCADSRHLTVGAWLGRAHHEKTLRRFSRQPLGWHSDKIQGAFRLDSLFRKC